MASSGQEEVLHVSVEAPMPGLIRITNEGVVTEDLKLMRKNFIKAAALTATMAAGGVVNFPMDVARSRVESVVRLVYVGAMFTAFTACVALLGLLLLLPRATDKWVAAARRVMWVALGLVQTGLVLGVCMAVFRAAV